jgi:hypothetical protein
MASHTAPVLRIKTLSRKTTRVVHNNEVIHVCARHNLREFQSSTHDTETGNINPHLSALNVILTGPATADAVAALAVELQQAADATVNRVNATLGAEVVFSLGAGTPVDTTDFFRACVEWLGSYFQVPILSAVCHYDQSMPHCHALLLPLRDNVWLGSKLFGNRTAIAAMHEDFHRNVGSKYNLPRATTRKKVPYKTRRKQSNELVIALVAKPELLNDAPVFNALVDMVVVDPAKLASAMRYDLHDLFNQAESNATEFAT